MKAEEKKALELLAVEVRKDIIRSTHAAGSGHPGGSLSAADYFTYLYKKEIRVDPKNPKAEDRDRFVLSKGHVAPGLYSILARCGFFPVEELLTLRKLYEHDSRGGYVHRLPGAGYFHRRRHGQGGQVPEEGRQCLHPAG